MDSLNTSLRVLLPYLEELGSARALTVAILLRYKEYAQVVSLKIDPRHYCNTEKYFADVQASSLLKKLEGLDIPGIDRRKAALKKWFEGEHQCYKTNERLSKFLYNSFGEEDETVYRFLRDTGKTIESWIGRSPPNLDKIRGGFGPGATFSDRGRLTTVPDKMTSTPTLTAGAVWYILPYLQTAWGREDFRPSHRRDLSWVRGNRFLTVPKTALIDRSIAVEPALNLFYQKGLGHSIRQRLNRQCGWDLDLAQDIHRCKARESSVSQEFATLDLSNASDTVSFNLVKLLLPAAWFEELKALRSPSTLIDGKWHVLEKFSSMGNGYTFELETLIFAALLSTLLRQCGHEGVLGKDLFVFGDDLIIPDDISESAISMLKFCGFSVNVEKTFSGQLGFRESCGGDYFNGHDVRPHYIKESINDPWQLIPTYNGLRRGLKKLASLRGRSDLKVLSPLLACMPTVVRSCKGPELLGDIVLHSHEEEWRFKWEHGIRYFRSIIRVNQGLPWKHWDDEVVLASALYGEGDKRGKHGSLGVIPRDAPFSMKVKWVPSS